MKLEKLTPEQEVALSAHRAEWFAIATSTEPADRPRAEAAARELAELGGVHVQQVVWTNTPEEGTRIWRESLTAWLSASLRASLSAWLSASLRDSLWESLWASLRASLWASLSASLWESLRDSLWNSLRESPWVAWYEFGAQLGVEYEPEAQHKLRLTSELLRSCFACWVGIGVIVLCERPATADVRDGKLMGLTWRE